MAKKRSKSKREGKTYRIEMTAMSIFLGGFCFFFLLSGVFVLGIMVGHGFLPGAVTALSDLKGQISTLQEMIGRGKSDDSRSKKGHDLEPKLAFYDKLSSKKEEAIHKRIPMGNKEAVQKEATESKEAAIEHSESKDRGKTERLSPKTEPKAPDPSVRFTVQIASLEDKKMAQEIVNNLLDKGYPAYFYEVKIKGRTFYRVRCRRFISREKAQKFANQLQRDEGMKGFVTPVESAKGGQGVHSSSLGAK